MKLSVVVIVVFLSLCRAEKSVKAPSCNIYRKCSLQEDPVWVTDGKKCSVFRNPCILANENCQRQNRDEIEFNIVPKEECQALCNPSCMKNRKPICGYYNDVKREFSNGCLFDYHICSTGETYMVYNEGQCEEPLDMSAI